MINRAKLFAFLTVAALSAAVLTGCSGSASSASVAESTPASSAASSESGIVSQQENSTTEPETVCEALLAVNTISNPFELTAMNMEYDFYLAAEDVVSYKGVKSNDNGDAGIVLVIQPAEGKEQTVKDALAAYQQSLIDTASNYPADFAQALENAQNALIESNGRVVVLVVNSNECTEDLTVAVNSALNG